MNILKKINKQETGQILVLAMIVVALCSLVVIPLLNYMGTGLRAINLYHQKTNQLYAADAGIQKAIWEINHDASIIHDRQNNVFGNSYTFPTFVINNNNVNFSLTYVWLLSGIVNLTNGEYPHSTWLGMSIGGQAAPSGNPNDPGTYTLTFTYDQSGNKKIARMGVWLPNGFTYVGGSSANFPNNIDPHDPALGPDGKFGTLVYGGRSLVWDVQPNFSFQHLNPPVATQTFQYLPGNARPTAAASWVESQSSDIGFQWDNALWWYNITSTATDQTNSKVTVVKATVVNNSGANPGMTLVMYLVNPS